MKTKQEWKISFEWPGDLRDDQAQKTGRVLSENIARAVHAALSRLGDGRAQMMVISPPVENIAEKTVFELAYQIRRRPETPANDGYFLSLDEAEAAIEDYYRMTAPELAFPIFAYRDRDGIWRHGSEDGRPGIIGEYQTRDEAWQAIQAHYDDAEGAEVVACVKSNTIRSPLQAS
jgi:hypothetical protein